MEKERLLTLQERKAALFLEICKKLDWHYNVFGNENCDVIRKRANLN